jgi:Bacterial Ig-like domain (group 2)/CARDB
MRSLLHLCFVVPVLASVACFQRVESEGGAEYDVLGIYVTPDTVVVPLGQTLQFTAWGLLDNRESTDLTSLATWTSSNEGVAEVTGSKGGVIQGIGAGTTTVYASYGGVESVPVDVTVTDAGLAKLTVSPDSVSIDQGASVQLSATATFTDGSYADATTQVRWVSADSSIAEIDGGLLVGASDGSTTVTAQWDTTVSPQVPVSVGSSSNSGQADLYVQSASGSISGGILSLTASIGNQGTASASGFWVDIFVDPSAAPTNGDYGDDYTWMSYVGADDSESISLTTEVGSGSHTVYVMIDGTETVTESDETNNVSKTTVSSGGSTSSKADLTITSFDWDVTADVLTYEATVKNTGDTAAGHFYVDVFADLDEEPAIMSDGDAWVEVDSMSAGGSQSFEYSFTGSCSRCYSYLLVDSYDEVDESDEDDNVGGPLTVEF